MSTKERMMLLIPTKFIEYLLSGKLKWDWDSYLLVVKRDWKAHNNYDLLSYVF